MPLTFYGLVLVVVVVIGANLNRYIRLTHTRTQLIMSFVSGIMLGVAVFHLLPHAVYSSSASIDFIAACLMAGLLGMFFLQRLFHFHHHEIEPVESHCAQHEHTLETEAQPQGNMPNPYGVLLGLGIHSLIDGLALASSIQADFGLSGVSALLPGLGVFVAIVLHKPLDALTLMLVMREQNLPGIQKQILLAAYALICPLMAAVGLYAFASADQLNPVIISATLAFSAGLFLCIALSDLLPEIHFHDHDRFKMTMVLLAGVTVSLLIKEIEAGERHDHVHQPASAAKSIQLDSVDTKTAEAKLLESGHKH